MAPPLRTFMASTRSFADDVHLHSLSMRDLQHPTHTQQVTLGVIAAYVVAIAILWNVPYLKMILWPFKVRWSFPWRLKPKFQCSTSSSAGRLPPHPANSKINSIKVWR